MPCHPSHKTRISFDASSYDEICINCGATDTLNGWGRLAEPCPKGEQMPEHESQEDKSSLLGEKPNAYPFPELEGYRTLPRSKLDDKLGARAGIRNLLRYLGQDPNSPGLIETPERVVRAFEEMTAGYHDDPATILGKVFEEKCDEIVILRDISFVSLCEHHLLPFSGTADVGYLPGKVVGLSKLARLVECFARRLQMQERLTTQIADSLMRHLEAKGAAVVVRASHACMVCRGVKKAGAEMVTSRMLGLFREDPQARNEFLSLCRG